MKNILMVIGHVFRDEEYVEPKIVLEDAHMRTRTASTERTPCLGTGGSVAMAGEALSEVNSSNFSAIIFVGGAGGSEFFDDAHAHRIARQMYDDGKIVAAICIAPSTLARAGLLEGKKATAFETQKDDLIAHGAEFTGAHVQVDGRIVTADGPDSATEFGEVIRDLIQAQE